MTATTFRRQYGRGMDCFCSCHACWACGELGCPGYCDDYQTYNLRPAETGGQP